jgi:hypothetical protein
MRISIVSDISTRDGTLTKDAKLVNAFVNEDQVYKRPAAQGGITIGVGTAQGGIGFSINGTPYFIGFWGDTMQTYTGSGTTWGSTTGYPQGSKVSVNFVDYWAIEANSGNQPPSASWSDKYISYTPPANTFGVFIGISTNSVFYSGDGITWVQVASPSGNWRDIAYSPSRSLFVAVKSDGTSTDIITSNNGVTWTSRTTPIISGGLASIVYSVSLGLFVAVSENPGTNAIITSSDGINWTLRTNPANGYSSVTFGNGLFVAVGGTGISTSIDGITWIARTCPAVSSGLTSVIYGGAKFVAVAKSGNNINEHLSITSTDGITWALGNICPWNGIGSWASVSYSPTLALYVVVSGSTLGSIYAASSPDGITWTTRTIASGDYRKVFWCNGLLSFVTNLGNISSDGITWSAGTTALHSFISDEIL